MEVTIQVVLPTPNSFNQVFNNIGDGITVGLSKIIGLSNVRKKIGSV